MLMVWEDIGSRDYMEDRISFDEDLFNGFSYYAVFDGHGGAQVSTFLKLNMKQAVKNELLKQNTEGVYNIPQALFHAFLTIIKNIPYLMSTETGSTAVVLLKKDSKIWVANCGDSRAIMNSGHDAVALTDDHKPNRTDEYNRIVKLGGKVFKPTGNDVYRVNGNLAVSRAIGDFALAPFVTWKPEIYSYNLTSKNSYILIGTDGIWDVLSNDDVVNIINKSIMEQEWKQIGNKLISLSRYRHSGDNIACILIIM